MNIIKADRYSFFDSFVSSVIITDKNSNILYCNKAFGQLTGYSLTRIKIGTPLDAYFKITTNLEVFNPAYYSRRNSPEVVEAKATVKDNNVVTVLCSICPMRISAYPAGLIINIVDISAESALHEKYKKR